MQLMPRTPSLGSNANAVSGDGNWVVGSAGPSAVRWKPGQPYEYLTTSVPPVTEAFDVSRDGSVVVGYYDSGQGRDAFRWTTASGFEFLRSPMFGAVAARAVSADGSAIAGSAASGDPIEQAFIWTRTDGMRHLGVLPGMTHSIGTAISDDGIAVIGYSYNTNTQVVEAFRWSVAEGMRGLGYPVGGGQRHGMAFGASADGSVIVGQADAGAFLWTDNIGARDLRQFLVEDLGLNEVRGWDLFTADAISDDGMVIVGTGFNPDGRQEAWIAVLPEPGALVSIGTAALLLLRRKRDGYGESCPDVL